MQRWKDGDVSMYELIKGVSFTGAEVETAKESAYLK